MKVVVGTKLNDLQCSGILVLMGVLIVAILSVVSAIEIAALAWMTIGYHWAYLIFAAGH